MKDKINRCLIGLSIAVVIVATLCVTFVFYGLFQRQVQQDLRVNAGILTSTGIFRLEERDEELKGDPGASLKSGLKSMPDLRVTWIDPEGFVLYDSSADAPALENHADRPEVSQAFDTGEGQSVRRSDTMDKNTVYYALRQDDGSVLRLSSDVSSIFHVFISVTPIILIIVLLIILASALIARHLTAQLLSPIDKISQDMENSEDIPVYEELIPFVDKIREQHDNILSAAKARQDFTANVSHELKTPLTAISGYAELIENHMATPGQEETFAEQIRLNSERLLSLIDDIIRLSELDNAENAVTFEEVDLYSAAADCIKLLSVSADKKNISLTLEGGPTFVRANKNMITELINNLCQNAIHYNRENGAVRVKVGLENDRPALIVADNGIGIPRDMQDRVFERFFRVDKSRSKETGGTGLGLAIVKHIVELHDAEISLESEVGEGTTITVRF